MQRNAPAHTWYWAHFHKHVPTSKKINIFGLGEVERIDFLWKIKNLLLCFKHTTTADVHMIIRMINPGPHLCITKKMWPLRSNFCWVRSIHHHFSGRKGGGGIASVEGLEGSAAWQPYGYWDRKQEMTLLLLCLLSIPPIFPFSPPLPRIVLHTWLGMECPI